MIIRNAGTTFKNGVVMGKRRACQWTATCPMVDGEKVNCINCPALKAHKLLTYQQAVAWWKAQ